MDFSAANTALWDMVVQFGIISAIILAANALRRNFKFFRDSLMPIAVLGGFMLLLLRSIGILHMSLSLLEMITYHGIGLGFIAMSLRVPEPSDMKETGKWIGIRSGSLIVSVYLFQAIMGLMITITAAATFSHGFFKAAGILLPMGYGQGPGQANNVGTIYEGLGMNGGRSFALGIAACGFLCACIVGVIYLNVLRRKGLIRKEAPKEISGSVTIEMFQHRDEVPVSESVDRLSVQVALVLIVYLLTYLLTWGITSGISGLSQSAAESLNSLIWGFNFITGSLLAMLLRTIMKNLRNKSIMTRQYQNNYLLSRISGLAFDLMIVAGIASIEIGDISGYWAVFLLMAVAGGIGTFYYMKWLCKKIYPDYFYEGFMSMYGMMTGTVSSGILLLREIDPNLKTPAANNLVSGSCTAIVFGAPMLIFIGMAPKSDAMLTVTCGIIVVYFAALILLTIRLGSGGKRSSGRTRRTRKTNGGRR